MTSGWQISMPAWFVSVNTNVTKLVFFILTFTWNTKLPSRNLLKIKNYIQCNSTNALPNKKKKTALMLHLVFKLI